MTPSHDREAALLAQALEKPVAERRAWLEAVCGEDRSLRQRLEALLAAREPAEKQPTSPSEPTGSSLTLDLAEFALEEGVGQTLGRYKLLEKIGEGGYGVVYVAEQEEPVRRRVALKIIKLGMDTRQVVARFEAERQALALMDHPGIAKVFDAGATDNGRPFFVMELVKGIPITRYCDEKKFVTRERLDLFILVCHAIQHAHQKGIIHRDIKPSNILVAVQEGKPVPKVIDFGIAKATQQKLTEKTLHTQMQQFIGTPAYMSPEQAELSGLDVDTRSDIYSLGVLLYELLVGKTPFDAQQLLSAGLDEIRRTILEKEPARPSTRLSLMGKEELTTTTQRRGAEASKLISLLRGDLDWIVMKCLEKDRARRYETANGLAADLRRHLNNEPVTARPPSAGYRLQKFVRRHKGPVVAASLVLLALVAGIAGTTFELIRARKARAAEVQRAEGERQAKLDAETRRSEAEAQKVRAEAAEKTAGEQRKLALETLYTLVTDVEHKLSDKAGLSDLRQSILNTAMDGLNKVSRSAETAALADRSMGVALQRMGDVLEGLGKSDEAFRQYQLSLKIFDRLAREAPKNDWIDWNRAISFDKLGAFSKEYRGDATAALDYFKKSLTLRQELAAHILTPEVTAAQRGQGLIVSYIKLAELSMRLGDPAMARVYSAKAQDAVEGLLATNPGDVAATHFHSFAYYFLGIASAHLNDLAASRQFFQKCLGLRQEAVKNDSSSAVAQRELGAAYEALGDMETEKRNGSKALESYGRAFELFEALQQKDPSSAEDQWYLAGSHYRLGCAKSLVNDGKGSVLEFSQSLKLRENLARTDPGSVQAQTELMLAQSRCGQTAQAATTAEAVRLRSPKDAGVLYTVACTYALCVHSIAGRKDAQTPENQALRDSYAKSAVESLEQAIELGYRDVEALRLSPDLAPIQNDPRFNKLLTKLRKQ